MNKLVDTVLICEVLHLYVTMKGTDYCLNSFKMLFRESVSEDFKIK